MEESKKDYPSLLQQGKNLSKFTLDVIKQLMVEGPQNLFVSPETYSKRLKICETCDRYDENQIRCRECGCHIREKANFMLESCPLQKWSLDENDWQKKFDSISKKITEEES
jgi:hypothetical protein